MASRSERLLLWCAATDSTFEPATVYVGEREVAVLAGKCIHCRRKLAVDLEGRPISHETVEHIVPRTHGGTDAVENLAIACTRCNQGKGSRLDHRRWDDPTLQGVIATLQRRRRARLRAALPGLDLPSRPGADGAESSRGASGEPSGELSGGTSGDASSGPRAKRGRKRRR